MSSSPKSEVHIPHDVSERIVEGADRSDSSVADKPTISHDNASNFDQALALGEHDSKNVTTRHPARGDSDTDPSPAREVPRDQLAQLRFETELAELTVRKTLLETELAELHVRKASAEFNAAEIRSATLELEWKTEDVQSRVRSRRAPGLDTPTGLAFRPCTISTTYARDAHYLAIMAASQTAWNTSSCISNKGF